MGFRVCFLWLLFSVCCTGLFAQKIKIVEGTYTYYAPSTMSLQQAEQEALRCAQIEALANEFGTLVAQSSLSVTTSGYGWGDKFYQEGASLVKGEWIETLGEPQFERGFYDNGLFVKCTVKGKAREIVSAKYDLDVKTLRNIPELNFQSNEFKKGDKIYLALKSSVDGCLAVFLHDKTNDDVLSLLPYKHDDMNVVRVEKDVCYTFFSKKKNRLGLRFNKEFVLGCEREQEVNVLYVVFSKNEFEKPLMDEDGAKNSLKTLAFDDFNSWLAKSIARDKDMQVEKRTIMIFKQ